MVRDKNELYLAVPSYFRCPISMDVMKSPVSLCTGVTYDRASIQKWLDSGHNTCPATMQVLSSTDIVPNLTLGRLIRVWSDFSLLCPESHASFSKRQAHESIDSFVKTRTEDCSTASSSLLVKIIDFAKISDENREFVASVDEFSPALVRFLRGSKIEVVELVVEALELIMAEKGIVQTLNRLVFGSDLNRDALSPFLFVLQKGSLDSRTKSAKLLETITIDAQSQRLLAEGKGLLNELCRLVISETDLKAIESGLSAIIAVSPSRSTKKELVRLGIVRTAGKILSGREASSPAVAEKVLKVLEMVSTCTEGRSAICDDESVVPATVESLLKVSTPATEHGIGVIWSVCYMSRDRTAQVAAMKTNGMTKVLLVMQSNCSPAVRQMCSDLVKVFRVNSKSCLASYETKTTHIMPY